MNDRLKNLAILLLDDEDGIKENAYAALLEILPESLAVELNKQVKAANGRFYLPEDHTLQECRFTAVPTESWQLSKLPPIAQEIN